MKWQIKMFLSLQCVYEPAGGDYTPPFGCLAAASYTVSPKNCKYVIIFVLTIKKL